MRGFSYLAFAVVFIILAGGLLFAWVENLAIWEGFYFAAATVTTVGYGDIVPQTAAGRLIAVMMMLGGVGVALYAFSTLLGFIVEGRLRQLVGVERAKRRIGRMRGHYIVCGYGKLGRLVVQALQTAETDFVLIERDPAKAAAARLQGYKVIEGDATKEETLTAAGLDRAGGLATTISADAENVFIGITVRALNPDLPVVCRSSSTRATDVFRRAGITRTISTDEMGANRIVDSLLRPQIVGFMEEINRCVSGAPSLHAVQLFAGSPLRGQTLRESRLREAYDVVVVAIRRGEVYLPSPGANEVLQSDDVLIVIGTPEASARLREEAEREANGHGG